MVIDLQNRKTPNLLRKILSKACAARREGGGCALRQQERKHSCTTTLEIILAPTSIVVVVSLAIAISGNFLPIRAGNSEKRVQLGVYN